MKFPKQKLEKYPQEPGVYLMKDAKSMVLYIGKAKNLKTRLKQYFFPGRDTREMIPYLISQIVQIDIIIVHNEKEALLLENTLIKKHKPKYNVMLKDDKTFVSLVLTHHKWPMLKLIRYKGKPKTKGTYFGPYTNAKAARQTLDLVQKLFPLRQCSDQELASRIRPCLLYDIKRCIAPCVEKCSHKQYSAHVKQAKELLLGKDKAVLKELRQKMKKASDALEFEKASDLHQMIRQIEHVLQVQHVHNPAAKDTDAIGLYRQADDAMIVLLIFREGKIIGSEHFSFHQILEEDPEILTKFLLQHYQLNRPPSQILIPQDVEDKLILEELLTEQAGQKVAITTPLKGHKLELMHMAQKNASSLFQREKDLKSLNEKMLLDLQEMLYLERFPRKIECCDTSNISGSDAVAAMVCFVNGEKDRKKMKLFKIKSAHRDDYAALYEVLTRHFSKQKEKRDFCDLLIVDGGKGQLNIALKVFKELNIASVDVIGVAKYMAKHTKGMTEEKVYIPHRKDPILINPRSPLLSLLQRIRDEAHRVAIQYHRKKRSKRTITTSLESIQGIGPIKRKRLLQKFGSLKQILKATDDQLADVKGITKNDIKRIRNLLQKTS